MRSWPFRRSPGGRHALGPAVTALPSGPPPRAPLVVPAAPASVVDVPPLEQVLDETGLTARELLQGLAGELQDRLAVDLPDQRVGRVELGFRDGSSTRLDPASEQARALEELARSLTATGQGTAETAR